MGLQTVCTLQHLQWTSVFTQVQIHTKLDRILWCTHDTECSGYPRRVESRATGLGWRYLILWALVTFRSVTTFKNSPLCLKTCTKWSMGHVEQSDPHRMGYPKTGNNQLIKKSERGKPWWISQGQLVFVILMDTKEVFLCSTVHNGYFGDTVSKR